MKKLFQTKYLTMLCFLVLLAIMFQQGMSPVCSSVVKAARVFRNTGEIDTSIIEKPFDNNFEGKNFFITLNGAYQNLMGAREVNKRYKLDNGHLTYVIGSYNMEEIAQNTIEFRDALSALHIPMVYVNTPFKIHQTDKQLPENILDYSNENANIFLEHLRKENVTTLDLRENIVEDNLDHYNMFYKTDHHWKAEAGLWAAGEISAFLSALDDDYSVEETILNPSSYTYEVHENIFLGSAGRRVGRLYAGMDDFTVITPNFETKLSFSAENGPVHREGSFSDVFIVRDALYPDDPLTSNVYSTYCGSSFSQMELRNHGTESGPSCTPKKLLLIRDSFSDVLIPFLSLGYEQLDVLDLRTFEGNLMDYIERSCPDMVLVVYNPGAYENNNLIMFDFLDPTENTSS